MKITAIVTAHREGLVSGPSIRSLEEAARFAESKGATVERLAVLDRPDAATTAMFDGSQTCGFRVVIGDFGDPGQSRNLGVAEAHGDYIALLDGDDLWSFNWLAEALTFCEASPRPVIAHPDVNMAFGNDRHLWCHVDSEDPDFDIDYMRVGNYWTALTFAARGIYRDFPFKSNDLARGYGHEDWHWNCTTLAAGVAHRPVPSTVHFIRRRSGSQMDLCRRSNVVIWPNPLSRYDHRTAGSASSDAISERPPATLPLAETARPSRPLQRNDGGALPTERDLIFDIGLHTGRDARYYLQKGFRVVGLEASPELCGAVQDSLGSEIADGRLTVVNRALWHEAGQRIPFFLTAEKDDWGSAFRAAAEKGVYNAREIVVDSITLSDLFDAHGVPYYLKCDIEGGDGILVRQLLREGRRPDFVSIEPNSIGDIACLEGCGYDRYQIVNQQFHQFWSVQPNPAREGRYVETLFDGHSSGLFGLDLDPTRWISFQEAADRYLAWNRLRQMDDRLAMGWLDIHAGRSILLDAAFADLKHV